MKIDSEQVCRIVIANLRFITIRVWSLIGIFVHLLYITGYVKNKKVVVCKLSYKWWLESIIPLSNVKLRINNTQLKRIRKEKKVVSTYFTDKESSTCIIGINVADCILDKKSCSKCFCWKTTTLIAEAYDYEYLTMNIDKKHTKMRDCTSIVLQVENIAPSCSSN